MSGQVDLHPVAVIVSLLVGGTLLGFTGLLVAIPLAAAGKGVLVYYMEEARSAEMLEPEEAAE
jgi:predicted PurR-regulated permease PerM